MRWGRLAPGLSAWSCAVGSGALPGLGTAVGAGAADPTGPGRTPVPPERGAGRGVVGFRPAPPHASRSAPERNVSVLSELRSVRAREGDGATFECTVSEVETTGSWELGGRPLRPGGHVRIRQEGLADFPPTLVPCFPAPGSDRPRPTRISPASTSMGPAP